jgi:hypothetical protein
MAAGRSFLDGAAARLVALCVALAAGAGVAYYHRNDLFPPEPKAGPALNPQFVACRDERVGQVEKMRTDGVIGDEQLETFKARAVAFCTDRFPPDAQPTAN